MGTVLRSVVFRVAAAVVGFAALGVVSASCLDTSGLAGGAEPVMDAGGPVEDTSPVNPNPCGKDLQNDLANCGTCGNVCGFGANSFPQCTAGVCKIGCNTNFGNCDNDDKNGCEDTLAGDPKNCNTCGRDCGGGTCVTGQCGPVNLAPKVDAGLADGYPIAFAIDSTSIFYAWYNTTGSYDIVKLDKITGVPVVLASGPGYPSHLRYFAVDDDPNGFVYYPRQPITYFPPGGPYTSTDGAILKLAKTSPDGGLPTPIVVTGGAMGTPGGQFIDSNTRIVVTATGIYYGLYGYNSGSGGFGGGVFKCPLTGACAPAQLANQYATYSLGVDGTSFVFNNQQAQNVIACPLVGCPITPPTPLATTTSAPHILVDAANYYWVNQNNASIVEVDKATSALTTLASGQPSPYSLAVDDKTVFMIGQNNPATLTACAITGCGGTPTPLVPNLTSVGGLAVDAKAIYWFTQTTGGSVFKVVK